MSADAEKHALALERAGILFLEKLRLNRKATQFLPLQVQTNRSFGWKIKHST